MTAIIGLVASVVPWNARTRSSKAKKVVCRASNDEDWRSFRARLIKKEQQGNLTSAPASSDAFPDSVSSTGASSSSSSSSAAAAAGWAHPVPHPEPGSLLLAHPIMFGQSQTYFSRAVILLFEHGVEGSAGLILNKPTKFELGTIGGAESLLPEFASSVLHLGGDVGMDTLHLVHRVKDLSQGSREIMPGLYLGGFDRAKEAIADGKASVDDFRWFTRYSGWGPGQLERECDRGVWFTVAASRDVCFSPQDMESGTAMWHSILELIGGEHAQLSQAVKEPNVTRGKDTPESSSTSPRVGGEDGDDDGDDEENNPRERGYDSGREIE